MKPTLKQVIAVLVAVAALVLCLSNKIEPAAGWLILALAVVEVF